MASWSSGEESGEDARWAAGVCSATGTLTLDRPASDPTPLAPSEQAPFDAADSASTVMPGVLDVAAGVPADATPLDALSASLDGLIGYVESGGLEGCDGLELVEFLRRFERVRNRMSLVDHAALAQAERQGLAGQLTQRSLRVVLVQALRISSVEAGRRVNAVAVVGERRSMLGERLDPRLPTLAAGQRAGEISPEQVAIVHTAIAKIDRPGLDADQVQQAEVMLARHARSFGPAELRLLGQRIGDHVDPDGTLPDDQLAKDRRDLCLTRLGDGSYRLEGRLTPAVGAQLGAVLRPLAKPRIGTTTRSDGTQHQELDERTAGQRSHDALEEVCARLLRVGGLPASGGTPATVIVTIDADTLRSRTGHGVCTEGSPRQVAGLPRLANEADILPAVLTTSGMLLDLGRSRRVANQNQTYALIARDTGCSFPGCAQLPEWCDRHHIREWSTGGKTDVNNMTLLCRYHHTHFVGSGWTCQLNRDGLPEWTPPLHVDPNQQPLINDRIRAHHTLIA